MKLDTFETALTGEPTYKGKMNKTTALLGVVLIGGLSVMI